MSIAAEDIVAIVLNRRQVFGLDLDTRIREAANHVTARLLFETIAHLDQKSPEFASDLADLLENLSPVGISGLIGFDTGDLPTDDTDSASAATSDTPVECFLKLVFCDEQAA